MSTKTLTLAFFIFQCDCSFRFAFTPGKYIISRRRLLRKIHTDTLSNYLDCVGYEMQVYQLNVNVSEISQLISGGLDEKSFIMAAETKKLNSFGTFGMEKMKQKDEEARLERMNTKQKRGTPTVRQKTKQICYSRAHFF